MQRIIVKNFGPVKDATIDLKKVVVIIGEQASGKSTLTRLIYFFKSLASDLVHEIRSNPTVEPIDIDRHFAYLVQQKFIDWFGTQYLNKFFNLKFYFDIKNKLYIALSAPNKKLNVQYPVFFSNGFQVFVKQSQFKLQQLSQSNSPQPPYWKDIYKLEYRIIKEVATALRIPQTNLLYTIAGRSQSVNYSELFEKHFFATVHDNIRQKQRLKQASIDDVLMFVFLNRSIILKQEFAGNLLTKDIFNRQVMKPILQASYHVESGKEYISPKGIPIQLPVSQASSGQQEAIRILQDIFVLMREEKETALRIIEEPEAHLFPSAQKKLIELLAEMVNQEEHNQLIINTHSPYILSIFNNLLFAHRVAKKNPDRVAYHIPEKRWLNGDDFAIYTLSHNPNQAYCTSIFDTDTQMIDQNYLDEVSEILGENFNALYQIHAQTFARK